MSTEVLSETYETSLVDAVRRDGDVIDALDVHPKKLFLAGIAGSATLGSEIGLFNGIHGSSVIPEIITVVGIPAAAAVSAAAYPYRYSREQAIELAEERLERQRAFSEKLDEPVELLRWNRKDSSFVSAYWRAQPDEADTAGRFTKLMENLNDDPESKPDSIMMQEDTYDAFAASLPQATYDVAKHFYVPRYIGRGKRRFLSDTSDAGKNRHVWLDFQSALALAKSLEGQEVAKKAYVGYLLDAYSRTNIPSETLDLIQNYQQHPEIFHSRLVQALSGTMSAELQEGGFSRQADRQKKRVNKQGIVSKRGDVTWIDEDGRVHDILPLLANADEDPEAVKEHLEQLLVTDFTTARGEIAKHLYVELTNPSTRKVVADGGNAYSQVEHAPGLQERALERYSRRQRLTKMYDGELTISDSHARQVGKAIVAGVLVTLTFGSSIAANVETQRLGRIGWSQDKEDQRLHPDLDTSEQRILGLQYLARHGNVEAAAINDIRIAGEHVHQSVYVPVNNVLRAIGINGEPPIDLGDLGFEPIEASDINYPQWQIESHGNVDESGYWSTTGVSSVLENIKDGWKDADTQWSVDLDSPEYVQNNYTDYLKVDSLLPAVGDNITVPVKNTMFPVAVKATDIGDQSKQYPVEMFMDSEGVVKISVDATRPVNLSYWLVPRNGDEILHANRPPEVNLDGDTQKTRVALANTLAKLDPELAGMRDVHQMADHIRTKFEYALHPVSHDAGQEILNHDDQISQMQALLKHLYKDGVLNCFYAANLLNIAAFANGLPDNMGVVLGYLNGQASAKSNPSTLSTTELHAYSVRNNGEIIDATPTKMKNPKEAAYFDETKQASSNNTGNIGDGGVETSIVQASDGNVTNSNGTDVNQESGPSIALRGYGILGGLALGGAGLLLYRNRRRLQRELLKAKHQWNYHRVKWLGPELQSEAMATLGAAMYGGKDTVNVSSHNGNFDLNIFVSSPSYDINDDERKSAKRALKRRLSATDADARARRNALKLYKLRMNPHPTRKTRKPVKQQPVEDLDLDILDVTAQDELAAV